MKGQHYGEPPENGSLSEKREVVDFIESVKANFERIVKKGAFVFDIDETLIAPDASLKHEIEVRDLLLDLLRRGALLGLISGGPGTVVADRIFEPLKQALGSAPELLRRLHVYANGGSSKYTADNKGRFAEAASYSSEHRISGHHLYRIKELIDLYAREGFGLGALLPAVTTDWKRKRAEQWAGIDVHFDDFWITGRPWESDLWNDEAMADVKAGKVKGYTTFPFINVRRIAVGQDNRIEGLSGISISGFYSLQKEKGDSCDLDWRDTIMERLSRDLGGGARDIVMRKAGRASIDITKCGTDKAAALFDFISFWKCDPSLVLYFGDEFFPGGNDLPIAEAPGLAGKGLRFVALNRREKPPLPNILWAGRSCAATREMLRRIL